MTELNRCHCWVWKGAKKWKIKIEKNYFLERLIAWLGGSPVQKMWIRKSKTYLTFLLERPIAWPGGSPPRDRPKCGFRGEACPRWTCSWQCNPFRCASISCFQVNLLLTSFQCSTLFEINFNATCFLTSFQCNPLLDIISVQSTFWNQCQCNPHF